MALILKSHLIQEERGINETRVQKRGYTSAPLYGRLIISCWRNKGKLNPTLPVPLPVEHTI